MCLWNTVYSKDRQLESKYMLFPSRPIEALPHKETSQRRHATNKDHI